MTKQISSAELADLSAETKAYLDAASQVTTITIISQENDESF